MLKIFSEVESAGTLTAAETTSIQRIIDAAPFFGTWFVGPVPDNVVLRREMSNGNQYALASNSTVYQYSGVGNYWYSISDANVVSIAAAPSGSLYAVKADNTVYQYSGSGTAWNPISGNNVQSFCIDPNGNLCAVTTSNVISEYNGVSWVPVYSPTHVVAIGAGRDGIYYLGDSGDLFRFTPGQTALVASGVASLAVSRSGTVLFLLPNGNLYSRTASGNAFVAGSADCLGLVDNGQTVAFETVVPGPPTSSFFGLIHNATSTFTAFIFSNGAKLPVHTWTSDGGLVVTNPGSELVSAFGSRVVLSSFASRSTAVTFHGDTVIANVEAQALYYGNEWNTDQSLIGQKAYLDGFLQDIVSSPYMDMLTQAGYGVGRGTATPGSVYSGAHGSSVTDSQIQAAIQKQVTSGALSGPDANRLYIVYMPAGIEVINDHQPSAVHAGAENSVSDFGGYHSAFYGRDANGQAIRIYYAVVTNTNGPIQQQLMTALTSLELADAVTDPDASLGVFGWIDTALGSPVDGEIGKMTESQPSAYYYLDGYYVQGVANKYGELMIPN